MKPDEFAAQVKKSIVDENVAIYRDLFENTEKASDPYWQRALVLFRSLDDDQRSVFFEVLRQTAIDSVSNIFAIIDGVAVLEGQDGECVLRCGPDEISGSLQDEFLVLFEPRE